MSRSFRNLAILCIVVVVSGFGSFERMFAPSGDLWPHWEAHNPDDVRTINHDPWDDLLSKYLIVDVAGPNLFRYGDVTAEDRALLEGYLWSLAAQPISQFNRAEQFAYWVNLYNALTVEVIMRHHPVASIRDIDISSGFLADGPWGKELIKVEGHDLSLNDIEHRILRPIWRDPRIHYVVNCASIGCPDLQPTAYRAVTLEQDMEAAARSYVNDPRGVTVGHEWTSVSKIYDWFVEDFGGTEGTVRNHLLKYAEPALADALRKHGRLDDVHYDWNLNEPGR